MKCSVCKLTKEKGEGRKRWAFTSERAPMSGIQIIFRLFELTKSEFSPGSICTVCYELLAQIDSLEFQKQEMTKTLKARINCCAAPEDYMAAHANDDLDGEGQTDDGDVLYGEDYSYTDDLGEENQYARIGSRKRKIDCLHQSVSIEALPAVKRERLDADNHNHKEGTGEYGDNDFDDEDEDYVPQRRSHKSQSVKEEPGSSGTGTDTVVRKPLRPVPNKAADNLDFNITITKTTRGQDQLVYEGYTYLKLFHQPANGDIAKWKCSSYYSGKTHCRAKISTTLDASCILLDSKTDHNHAPPEEKHLQIIMFREQVKQIANNHPDMKPAEILSSARMLLDTPTSLGIKDGSITRYIQRIRMKNRQQAAMIKAGMDRMEEEMEEPDRELAEDDGLQTGIEEEDNGHLEFDAPKVSHD